MPSRPLKVLWRSMSGVRSVFALALLCVAIAALVSLFTPLVLRFTLDSVLARKSPELPGFLGSALDALGGTSYLARNLWICALALLATAAVNALFSFMKGSLSAIAAERTTKNLRDELAAHIDALPSSYFSKMSAGDLVQRSTSDMDTVRRLLATQVEEVGRAVCLLVFTVVMMASIDIPMTLVSIPVVPAVFLFSFFFYKKIQRTFLVCDEAEASLTHVLEENLHGIRVVRAFAREDFEIGRFDEKNRFFTGKVRDLISLFGWYWGISVLLCAAQESATIAVGAGRVASGILSTGTYMAFIAYVGNILWPVRQLGRTLTEVSKAMVSLGRITEVLNEKDEYADDKIVASCRGVEGERVCPAKAELAQATRRGRVEFDRLTVEYEEGKAVLSDVSFAVESGETVAILGRTGSGKSSIAAALVRLVEPSSGAIRLDGVDIREMDRRELREKVGLVLQEPYLFSRSMRENVELGSGTLEEGELERAARLAALDSVVASFESGWDTAVGEEGVTLSGGQRQRLALARVLAKRPSVLVLDDTLSALDTETDAMVRRELAAENAAARAAGASSQTTIIVAHRITTLMAADRIVVLEAGRVADIGSHEELVAKPGLYRRVWEIQGGESAKLAASRSRALIGE
jgi:ABC-type multidrug transport system, ATPase and permease components